MDHLLAVWPDVARRLRSAEHVLLLSDYDGTLTPIVERPELAELPPQTREVLERLVRRHNLTVGIISGRALGDLKARLGLEGIVYAGNHGLEMEGPGLWFVNPLAEEIRPLLRLLHLALLQALSALRGVLVEDKGLTLSVHYRQVDSGRVAEVKSALESVVSPSRAGDRVRVMSGKKVYEVRPAVDWDKGKAIELLLGKYSRGRRTRPLLLYLGDDLTDEDGFRAVNRHDGISVFVGKEEIASAARYCLRSSQEVHELLGLLLELKKVE